MSDSIRKLALKQSEIIQEIMASEGEIQPEQEEILKSVIAKVDDCQGFLLRLESEEEYFQKQIERLEAHVSRIKSRHEWLRNYIYISMKASGQDELVGEYTKFVIQKNPHSVVIENEELIDIEYKKKVEKVTWQIDKNRLKEDLKAGMEVPGAKLTQTEKLVSKENSILVKGKKASNE